MKKTIYALAVAAMLTNATHAQQAQQPDALKRLLEWAGQWEGPATMTMDGKELHFTYYADFRKVAAGNGINMHEWCTIPGMGKLDGNNLIGFDPFDGKIHWYSVDNLGTTHEHIGEFSDKNHFTMVHRSMREGKTYVETIEMTLTGKDKMSLKLTAVTDGHEDQQLTATFSRKKQVAKNG